MFEMTNENFARLLSGLTIAVGNRKNRILFYRFLAAEIRALHYSYGVGDSESYKRALTFLEKCERLTLRNLIRNSAGHHVEVTVDSAKRIFLRALEKLNAPSALSAYLMPKDTEGARCCPMDRTLLSAALLRMSIASSRARSAKDKTNGVGPRLLQTIAPTMRRKPAALRDCDPAYVRYGSKAESLRLSKSCPLCP